MWGVCRKGFALAANQTRNSSPCVVLIWPSNTVGYLLITALASDDETTVFSSLICTEGEKIGMG